MATISIAANGLKTMARAGAARFLVAFLVITFVASYVTALAHEFEHVLHQHETPCALHIAADSLSIATAPTPPATPITILVGGMSPCQPSLLVAQCPRSSGARAPPCLA
jgi:hypothetical protein